MFHIPLKNEVKPMVRVALAKHDQLDKFHTNPKALYGYVRDKSGPKPKIGQVVRTDGILTLGVMERKLKLLSSASARAHK